MEIIALKSSTIVKKLIPFFAILKVHLISIIKERRDSTYITCAHVIWIEKYLQRKTTSILELL